MVVENVLSQKLRHQNDIFWLGKELPWLVQRLNYVQDFGICIQKKGHVCNSAKNVPSNFFILHPLHTFLLFKTHVKKCKKKPIRIRMCRFLLTAKNDCRYTVFKIDLKKVYCTGPQKDLKIQGGGTQCSRKINFVQKIEIGSDDLLYCSK